MNTISSSLNCGTGLALALALGCSELASAQTTVTHDPVGNRLSQAAAITGQPTVIAHPVGRLGRLGDAARFSVVAGGPGPFSYQWFAGASPIPGATTDVLVLPQLQAGDFTPNPSGQPKYSCRITNGSGSVDSNAASLFRDTNGRGLPDWWQLLRFGSLGVDPAADADSDGRTNLQEYLDGTDPNSDLDRFFQLSLTSPPGLVRVSPAATHFAPNSTATLTATSAGELQFAGWLGVAGTDNPLSVTMDADRAVTAVFTAMPLDDLAPVLDFSPRVEDIAVQPDGTAYIVGSFNGGVRTVLRLRPDTTIDPTFDCPLAGAAFRIVLLPDGKVVVAGQLNLPDNTALEVVRLQADGSVDPTFAGGGLANLGQVRALVAQPDGKILVGGFIPQGPGLPNAHLIRFQPNGTPDPTFTVALDAAVTALARSSDGRVYLAGEFETLNHVASKPFARLHPDGATDAAFVPGVPMVTVINQGRLLALPNGQVLFGGAVSFSSANTRGLARFHADGSLDQNFHREFQGLIADVATADVFALARQGDRLIVGGVIFPIPTTPLNNFLRLKSDGSLDRAAFRTAFTDAAVFSAAVQSDGSVLYGGVFGSVGGEFLQGRPALARVVTTNHLRPGTLGASPAGPVFAANASTTLSLSPQTLDAPIASVGLEVSSDGIDFEPLGNAERAGNSWTYTVPALPAGTTYYRAAVTDTLQQQRRSFAVGPLTTPPAVLGATAASGTVGLPFTYTARATGPLTAFTATGLPAWATGSYDANLEVFTISGTPTTSGFFTVLLRPANAAGLGSTALGVTIANRFAAWQNAHFSPAELANPAISGPAADATGAGFPNLLRYALGVPAERPGVAGLPSFSAPSYGGTRYLTLTYTRDRTAPDVTLAVQVSGNLMPGVGAGWNTGPSFVTEVSRTDLGNGTETVVTRDNIPLTGASQRFIRLQATPQ